MRRYLAAAIIVVLAASSAFAGDYFVSAARGKGKKGSKEEPVRDLGILVPVLAAGDTVHIAEGVYLGRSENGSDVIEFPVRIIGGYSDDFSKRDPWGAHRTILAGNNTGDNFDRGSRLSVGSRKYKVDGTEILIDGIIVDNGVRNGYTREDNLEIRRMFAPKSKSNAAPDSPGITVEASTNGTALVQNCVVMNCAPTHKIGALRLTGGKNSKVAARNNLVINNTGSGINCTTWHQGSKEEATEHTLENNTILFSWKFDALSTEGGMAVQIESGVKVIAIGNVFGFSDTHAVANPGKCPVALTGNLFCAYLTAPYLEFSTKHKFALMEEEAQCLTDCTGNVKEEISLSLPEAWTKAYASRVLVDRAAAEASVEPLDNYANSLRKMLGLPLDGGKIEVGGNVWLPKLDIDGGLKAGAAKHKEKYGCSTPKPE